MKHVVFILKVLHISFQIPAKTYIHSTAPMTCISPRAVVLLIQELVLPAVYIRIPTIVPLCVTTAKKLVEYAQLKVIYKYNETLYATMIIIQYVLISKRIILFCFAELPAGTTIVRTCTFKTNAIVNSFGAYYWLANENTADECSSRVISEHPDATGVAWHPTYLWCLALFGQTFGYYESPYIDWYGCIIDGM